MNKWNPTRNKLRAHMSRRLEEAVGQGALIRVVTAFPAMHDLTRESLIPVRLLKEKYSASR